MTRTWIIPAGETHDEIRFSLREPGLTGDNLGHKTWATSHTVAKLLEVYLQREDGKMCSQEDLDRQQQMHEAIGPRVSIARSCNHLKFCPDD
jgi:hypothetical protein